MACAQGALAKLCVEPGASAHTFDTSSEPYDFKYETLMKRPRVVGGNGIRGTRDQDVATTRYGSYPVGGRLALDVTPAMLDLWLPRILGGSETADNFPLAESLPSFGVLVDRVTQTFQYTDCVVNRAVFHAKAGVGEGDPDLLEVVLELMGKNEITGTTFPVLTLSTASNARPYIHPDGVFTFASAAREIKEFWVMVDNHVQPRWVNSLTATALCPHDRTVVVRAIGPYDSGNSNLYGQAIDGATGTIVWTQTGVSTTFTFGRLQAPINSPTVRGKTEIDMEITLIARATGATPSLNVTHDSVV
jgi:hypothetical protein